MGHVEDRWWSIDRTTGKKARTDRHGTGKRWLAVWEERGQRRKKSFTVKDAALTHLRDVETGRPSGETSFADAADAWKAAQLQWRPSTIVKRTRDVAVIKTALAGLSLAEVTRPVVQQLVQRWTHEVAATTVRDRAGVLYSILDAAHVDHLLADVPAKVKLPPLKRARVEPLTIQQVRSIAAAVGERYRIVVWLGAGTGMRISEMLGLRTDRIRWTKTGATVRVDQQLDVTSRRLGELKTRSSERRIPIDKDLAALLRDHMARHPSQDGLLVIGPKGGPASIYSLTNEWQRATTAMGLRDRSGWHELRHFHASMLIAAGLSPRAVADRLGHSDPALTLRVYSHLWPDDEQRASTATGALWESPGLRAVESG